MHLLTSSHLTSAVVAYAHPRWLGRGSSPLSDGHATRTWAPAIQSFTPSFILDTALGKKDTPAKQTHTLPSGTKASQHAGKPGPPETESWNLCG